MARSSFSQEQQNSVQYTELELLGWIQKQLQKINQEYQLIAQFDQDRIKSSTCHKIKNLLRIGNIRSIDTVNKIMKDPQKTDRRKLLEAGYTLLAIVDRDRNLGETDKHHTSLMISLLLLELAKYDIPKNLRQEIQTVLAKRYPNFDPEIFFSRYTMLAQSLKNPPQLEDIFFIAKERLQKAKCLVMVSLAHTLGVIFVTIARPIFVDRKNKKVIPKTAKEFLLFSSSLKDWGYQRRFEYVVSPYVFTKNAQGQLCWQRQSANDKSTPAVPKGITSNEQLLRHVGGEKLLHELLYYYPDFSVNNESVVLFPLDQEEARKHFKCFCENPPLSTAEKLRQEKIEQTDPSLRRTLGGRGSLVSG